MWSGWHEAMVNGVVGELGDVAVMAMRGSSQ
jgi:hypothetical protein